VRYFFCPWFIVDRSSCETGFVTFGLTQESVHIHWSEEIESILGGTLMVNREKVLDEIFELALQNDMKYFG